MTDAARGSPDRFRFLATYMPRRAVDVTEAPAGNPHGQSSGHLRLAGGSVDQQRREMLVQAALLGAGSLDPRLVKGMRARATTARRTCTRRPPGARRDPRQIPLDAASFPTGNPAPAADESLEVAELTAQGLSTPLVRCHQTSGLRVYRRARRAGHEHRPQTAVRPHRPTGFRGRGRGR